MLPLSSEQTLSELLIRKEEEWRMLQAQHTQLQEAALQGAQSQLEEAQGKLRRLQEDFLYNLKVLEERDLELEQYDAAFAQAKGQEEARQAEVSELKIEVAKLKQELAREARRVEELQQQQQLRLQEHRLELDRVHSDRNGEIDHQREQYEHLQWRLERRLKELDGELALQRQELLLEFESEMQKREHEFQLQADGMSSMVLSHELKVKLLNKELEALREAGAQAAECLQRAEAANAKLQRRLQGCALELQDLGAQKDSRIKDLEDKLHSVQLTRKKEEEAFKRKHEELDRLAREKEAVLTAVKDAHVEQLGALEAQVLELQTHNEALQVQLRRAEWAQTEATREKEAVIDKLREDAAALKASWDTQIAQMSKEVIARDLQVQTLQEEAVKHRAQSARFQQDLERYKKQLSLAVERERSLEREQVQLGLDWQRRCESIERDQIQRSEALIQGLAEARGQVAAKLQETERALHEREVVLKAVTLERDQAVEMLQTHGLLPAQEILQQQHKEEGSRAFPSGEIQRLQEQNTSLRSAVTQMRREMETLSDQVLPPAQAGGADAPQPDPGAAGDAAPPRYVLALEEVQTLECKFRALGEELASAWEPPQPPSGEAHPSARAAADTAGESVAASQASIGLALRKLRGRVHLLNLLVIQLRKKVQQKPLELDTIQQELPSEVAQVHLEALELQRQVAELEKHFGTAHQEGASGRKHLSREGLTDERSIGTKDQGPFPRHPQPPQVLSVPHLQRKLKEAAKKILHLHLEKEQLVEMGNRLRAELAYPKGTLPYCLLPPTPQSQEQGQASGLPLGQAPTQSTAQRAPESLPVTCRSPQKESSPRKALPPPVPEEDSGHTHRSSSLASSSLQDTWRLLDLGSSPSGLPSQDDSAPELPASAATHRLQGADRSPVKTQGAFDIKGKKMAAQSKAKPARPSKSHPAKSKSCRQPPRIRNYNMKD